MNRFAALLLAFVFAGLTVSSACSAASPEGTRFTLRPERSGLVQASFSRNRGDHDVNNWSSSFSASQLTGLDLASFRRAGTRPLRFAVVRETGRLDCSGHGGQSRAEGNCSFTPDPGFSQLLMSHGIGRPTADQAFGLMALDVRRATVDALAAARYPTPSIGQLMALTAVGVTGDYIRGLANIGYRPAKLDALVAMKALDISPDYVGGFIHAGYGLSSNELVQLKALGITPEFARSVRGTAGAAPSVHQLVRMHLFGTARQSR